LIPDLEISPQEWKDTLDQLVERLVDHYLVLEYGRDKGISVSETELEAAIREIRRDYADGDFQETLLKRAVDFEEWKEGLKEHLLVRKILRVVMEELPPLTHEEILAYFDAHARDFRHPAMVRARQVVVRSRGEAQAVLKRLQGGEKMEELAGVYSISPESKRQGDMGWIARGQMHESMEKALFSLSPGQTSPIVESPYGFHIFQVVSRKSEGQKAFPEVRAEIEEKLTLRKEELFFGRWLQDLRNLYPVTVDRQVLERLEWD
jgi:parvulin-like peptidyl-prolyl isomerase